MTAATTAVETVPAPAAPAGGAPGSLQTAWLVFGSLTLLLTLFLVVITILMLDRRRRRGRRSAPRRAESGIDAWTEAGRRTPPFGPSDDD